MGAYVPTSLLVSESLKASDEFIAPKTKQHRHSVLSTLHNSLFHALDRVTDKCFVGVQPKEGDGNFLWCRPVLTSYIGDIIEVKDVLGVKETNKMRRPYFNCEILKECLRTGENFNTRKFQDVSDPFERCTVAKAHSTSNHSKVARDSLAQNSVHFFVQYLSWIF